MWRWLSNVSLPVILGFLAVAPSYAPSYAIESSVGPTSSGEARILWQDGHALYEAGKYDDAIVKLQRLHDRYPGYPDAQSYREQLLWLGNAYLEKDRTDKAIEYLRSYLEGAGHRDQPLQAKVWLGEAYLRNGDFNEAYLISLELEKDGGREVQAQALFLRARAQLGLGKDDQADLAVSSAQKVAQELGYPNLEGQAAQLKLELKTRQCARRPAAKRMTEGQVIHELTDRGVCLSEALPLYRKSLDIGHGDSLDRSQMILTQAFASYWSACHHPPAPPRLKGPKDRDSAQRARYRSELVDRLQGICRIQIETSRDILKNWISQSPRSDSQTGKIQDLDEKLAGYVGKKRATSP